MNLKDALMCAIASDAVYCEWTECRKKLDEYIDSQYVTRILDYEGSQAYGFKRDADTAVIAFRGTDPHINDIVANLMVWHDNSVTQGDVHTGFKRELDKIYPALLKWIKSRAINKTTTVYVTGHSLGGAMASLCAARLHNEGYNVILYTYGSPRVGDKKWASQFESIEVYRFINCNDIVTVVPPHGLYHHIGKVCYLDYNGKLHQGLSWIRRFHDKIRGLFRAWQKGEPFSSLYDHESHRYVEKINALLTYEKGN